MSNVDGLDQVKKNLEALSKKYGEAVVKAGGAAAQLVRTSAIKSIQQKSSGEAVTRYRSGGNSYQHTASAAGDAPNSDTGALVRSVQVEIKPNAIYVGSKLNYAGHLEFGTSKMNARPWLFPALEKSKKEISDIYGLKIKGVK